LEDDPSLKFELNCLHLIELIKSKDVDTAVRFAQTHLAQVENEAFQKQVREIMTLLIFENISECPLSGYLSVDFKNKVAERLQAAILASQCNFTGDDNACRLLF
jgi:hypothetical protein